MPVRRPRKHAVHLEVTAFINVIVVLVPFLLSTAVFTRLSVVELKLPQAASEKLEQLKANNLQLEVVIRKDALEVGDRIGGLIQRIPAKAVAGTPTTPGVTPTAPDYATLAALMLEVKKRFPEARTATVLAEPDTAYDLIVQVMDAMRATYTANGAELQRTDLFPELSMGDAPVRQAVAASTAKK